MAVGSILLGFFLGYVCGSVPVGYFVGRLHGVDVRQHGSGRTGGSNVLRTVGWPGFVATIAGDAVKGFLPVLAIMRWLAPASPAAAAATVVGVLVGNNWSILIALMSPPSAEPTTGSTMLNRLRGLLAQSKGGAGVITTAAATLAVYAPAILPLVVLALVILILFRYSSLASITVAALYPLDMAFFILTQGAPPVYGVMSVIAAVIVLVVLYPNLQRLLAGKERKFGERVETRA